MLQEISERTGKSIAQVSVLLSGFSKNNRSLHERTLLAALNVMVCNTTPYLTFLPGPMSLLMHPTSEKLEGHIAFGSSSVHPSVRFCFFFVCFFFVCFFFFFFFFVVYIFYLFPEDSAFHN